jgi:hypothetical protein
VLDYRLVGDFGVLRPDRLDIRSALPANPAHQATHITLRFALDQKQACIAPNLHAMFANRLTHPHPFYDRSYEFRDCKHYDCGATRGAPETLILTQSSTRSVTFGYYANNCLDEVVLTDTDATAPRDHERKRFEFITREMNVDEAKEALSRRGFACGPNLVAGPGRNIFICNEALPPNRDGFKSEHVEIWREKDGEKITGVLIGKEIDP